MSNTPLDLGKRERQIVEAVYRLGEASVAEVLKELVDPPRTRRCAMLGLLVEKGVLKLRQDGRRYLYRPALPREKARKSVLKNVVSTFFAGEPMDAMVALLDVSADQFSEEDLRRMRQLIERNQREDKK